MCYKPALTLFLLISLNLCMMMNRTVFAQITTGNISGKVLVQNKPAEGIRIIVSEESTGLIQESVSNKTGHYQFQQLHPGGPYQLQFQSAFTDTLRIHTIEVLLGKTILIDASLTMLSRQLKPVLVVSSATAKSVNSTLQFSITSNNIEIMPQNGRDYAGLFNNSPQAYVKDPGNGAVSFSGQNNRYNSLYINGALQNDVFGLSASGTYGGQTQTGPVAIETIEQLQVQLSPYDASLGEYTGAAINMVTKSGKNKPYSGIYRYIKTDRELYNNTGIVLSGPVIKNKFYYYFNADHIREEIADPFNYNTYEGDTKNKEQLQRFIQSVKTNYGYDPGTTDAIQKTTAAKLSLRIDKIIRKKHLITASFRQNFSERFYTGTSTPQFLFFSNNGKQFISGHFSGTIEMNSRFSKNKGNQLVIGFSNAADETRPMGKPFPSLSILDGEGFMFLGSNEDAIKSKTNQTSWSIRNKFYFNRGKHSINAGFEVELSQIRNLFLQNSYGSYFYYSLSDYLRNFQPADYRINYSLNEKKQADFNGEGIKYGSVKTAFFANEQLRLNKTLTIHAGIRISAQQVSGDLETDSITVQKVIPAISALYDLAGAEYGSNPSIKLSVSPRINISIRIPERGMNIEIGTGLFGGRMPLAWLGGIYSNNGLIYESFEADKQQLKKIRFASDVYQQPLPAQFGIAGNKGVLNLVTNHLRMPSVWRSHLLIHKSWNKNWWVQLDGMYYFNQDEINFTNVNLLPPTDTLSGPDNRVIYSGINSARIPVLPDSTNPYDQIILLSNNKMQNGFGYRYGIHLQKKIYYTSINLQYAFGESWSVYDGNYSVLLNQWKLNEQVNGRNDIRLARSDFSPGHRINISAVHEWFLSGRKKKLTTVITYNGNSGKPFSYVYGKKSLTRDDVNSTGYDLIYIPTSDELSRQLFLPLISENTYYTGEQQKEALEWYFQNNQYLNSNRGNYAERNGSREAFNHSVNIKFLYYTKLELNKRNYGLTFSAEILNLGNLINNNWGKYYPIPGNRIRLINFEGFASEKPLLPSFSFDPGLLKESTIPMQKGRFAGLPPEWLLQLGFRINFY